MTLMTVPEGLDKVLVVDPEIMSGALCFRGTRIPIQVLFDNLEEGMGADEFVQIYPTVTKQQVGSVIEWGHRALRIAAGRQLAS